MTTRTAVVGLGNLGAAMARRLAAGSGSVLVHDTDEAALARAAQDGCTPADDLPSLAAASEVVWVVVPDDDAVRSVLEGPDGLAARMGEGGLVLLASTVSPGTAQAMAGLCAGHGIGLVEAPVSGGADAAEAGELLVLLGGEEADVDRAREHCAALAGSTVATGPAGTAAVVKLCNQYVLFTGLGALYEAVDLAGRVGVDEAVLLEALAGGTARSWAVDTWGFYDRLSRDYDGRDVPEKGRPWVKDLAETLRVATDHGLDLPTARSTADLLPEAIRRHAQNETSDGGTQR